MGDSGGTSSGHCPVCGAVLAAGFAFCKACGAQVALVLPQAAAQQPSASASPPPSAPIATVSIATADADAAPEAPAVGTRRCQWCGTENPVASERCQQCGAAFPKPEQDAALQRAADERMRLANEELETMRKQRVKRSWWRLFG